MESRGKNPAVRRTQWRGKSVPSTRIRYVKRERERDLRRGVAKGQTRKKTLKSTVETKIIRDDNEGKSIVVDRTNYHY